MYKQKSELQSNSEDLFGKQGNSLVVADSDVVAGITMKKLGYEPSRTHKGKCYIVVRILMPELEQEGKHVAKQILNPELPL